MKHNASNFLDLVVSVLRGETKVATTAKAIHADPDLEAVRVARINHFKERGAQFPGNPRMFAKQIAKLEREGLHASDQTVVLAAKQVSNTPSSTAPRFIPAPAASTAPVASVPAVSPQVLRDAALVSDFEAVGDDPCERTIWLRKNGDALHRAVARMRRADAVGSAQSYRAAEVEAIRADDRKLASEYRALTNVAARRDFMQKHPSVAHRVAHGSL
jgi:hypothetical protein